MKRNPYSMLIFILLLIALAMWVDLSKQITIVNPINQNTVVDRNVDIRLGLDLRGGLQTLLEADLPADVAVSSDDLQVARTILENRANALGVSEVIMQIAPPRRIVAEFPGLQDPQQVVASLQKTGLLEFVDMGDNPLAPGTVIKTDYGMTPVETTTVTPTLTPTPSEAAATPAPTETASPAETVYHTVVTGDKLD